jgi:uncharacterized membrane protein YcaP (DUF421 family)
MLQDMFHIPIPILEKILRPILVYLALIILIRCFGKRELAQLNPFDLVVLLSLSNTVQNAIIGDDNSLSGGIIGAFTLLAINWLVVRMLYSSPRMNRLLGGVERTLIEDGRVDNYALKKELLSQEDLLTVVHRQGFETFDEVSRCVLEPNGSFYIEARKPSPDENRQRILVDQLEELNREVKALRERLG